MNFDFDIVHEEIIMWQERGHSLDNILVSIDRITHETRWGDVVALTRGRMALALALAYGNDDGVEEMMTAKDFLETFGKDQ